MQKPTILSPASPSDLLTYTISHHRHPTTLLIGTLKKPFLEALTQNISSSQCQLLQKTLLQTAVSRHIPTIFIPTVTHLRAYISTFTPTSKIPPPPNQASTKPVLLIYGFLELHRATSEWSAQGIATSAAEFIEAAARTGFKAVIVEPKGGGGYEDLLGMMGEKVPLLSGTTMKEDGGWNGRTIDVGRVLGRWFELQEQEW